MCNEHGLKSTNYKRRGNSKISNPNNDEPSASSSIVEKPEVKQMIIEVKINDYELTVLVDTGSH